MRVPIGPPNWTKSRTFIRLIDMIVQSTRKPEVLVGGRFGFIHIKLSMVYDYVSS